MVQFNLKLAILVSFQAQAIYLKIADEDGTLVVVRL